MLENRTIAKSALINLVLFTAFIFFCYPVYNSWEDANILYLLSGSYATPPTELLHYNHLVHPFLGWCIKNLFVLNNNVNWYSAALIFAHYLSFTIILASLTSKKNSWLNYAAYAALFIVFEGYFLLYPDFTSASIALTMAALLLMLTGSWTGSLSNRRCIAAGILLLLASFYRIHSMIPLIGVALPFFALTINKKAKIRFAVVIIASTLCILACNQVQQFYYKTKKPDWPQEEAYRSRLFRFFNESASIKIPQQGEQWHNEFLLVTKGSIIDTAYIRRATLDSMYHDLKNAPIRWKFAPGWFRWFWINNRLFFGLAFCILIFFGLQKNTLPAALASAVFLIAGFLYLLLRAKAPPYILISLLSFFCFAVFFHGRDYFDKQKKIYKAFALVIMLLFVCWGAVRLYRTSRQNRAATLEFKQQYAEVAAHPQNLFIHVKNFGIREFSAWDAPGAFKLPNYLHSEHFINGNYYTALKNSGITDIRGIFYSPRVLFWGQPSGELKAYFEKIAGKPLIFSGPLKEFHYGSVWKIEQENEN